MRAAPHIIAFIEKNDRVLLMIHKNNACYIKSLFKTHTFPLKYDIISITLKMGGECYG